MSNLNIHQSQSGIPISTPQQKPLTQSSGVTETHPQPETVNKPPLTESGTQMPTLSHSETLESIETSHASPKEMQQTSGQISGLRQSLALSIGISEDGPLHPVPQQDDSSGEEQGGVDKTPPPKYSGEQLQSKLTSHLRDHSDIQKFSKNLGSLEQTVDSVKHSESQLKTVDETLEKTLKDLDKRKQAYNAPLYRLAAKLGIKSRKTKLAQLEQLRSSALKSHEALTNLNKLLGEDGVQKLEKLPGKIQGNIQQAKTDGQNLVNSHLDDKAMMWSLSTQSKGQLRETLAQSLVSELHGGQELVDKYQQLSQDHSTRFDAFQELRAQLTLYDNRIKNFNKMIRGLEETSPQEAQELKARFAQEKSAFEKSLIPLITKTNIQGETSSHDIKLLDLDDHDRPILNQNTMQSIILGGTKFPDAPPKLYDLMPEHHQQYIDAMAGGIQASLPNKLLDDLSLMLNGEKYVNKTKLTQSGMGEIFTYTSESDPTKKIVVKVPIKPEGMSDEEFQHKLETESARELDVHYHAMGANGQGHSHLLSMLGAISTDKGPLIATPFVDKGDCLNLTHYKFGKLAQRVTSNDISVDEQRLVNKHVLYQMLDGMQHLHDRGITHMDVKPDQFLIDSKGQVMVSDFGMSKTLGQFQAKLTDRGDAPTYLAPEVMSGNLRPFAEGREISNKVDVWSMGVIAHQMLMGGETRLDSKFMTKTESQVGEFGHDMNNRMFPQPQNETEVFLNKMFHPDPNQRPSCKELMQDPIFNELFAQGNRGSYRQDVTDLVVRELNA